MLLETNDRLTALGTELFQLGGRAGTELQGERKRVGGQVYVSPAAAGFELRQLERTLEQAKRALAESMRARGASWAQIGDALGVTKQAAQQRYSL